MELLQATGSSRPRPSSPPTTATSDGCFHTPSKCSWNLRILVVPLVSSCGDACLMSLILVKLVNWCLSMMLDLLDLRHAPLPSPCDPFPSQFPLLVLLVWLPGLPPLGFWHWIDRTSIRLQPQSSSGPHTARCGSRGRSRCANWRCSNYRPEAQILDSTEISRHIVLLCNESYFHLCQKKKKLYLNTWTNSISVHSICST
jgi:hypothetical protein